MSFSSQYSSKLCSFAKAADLIQNNYVIGMDSGPSHADGLINAIIARAKAGEIRGVSVHTMLDLYPFDFYAENISESIRGISWFAGTGARKAINSGYADLIPGFYRDIPEHIRRNYDFDVSLFSVSPMDSHGYFTLGLNGSNAEAILEKSARVFVEVNENQPRAVRGIKLHINDVDLIVENHHPLPELAPPEKDNVSETIAGLIAEQILDGSCIQLGIGAVPDAVGMALKSKRDLGIHSEMFTDSMVALLECGAVNNSKKQIHRGLTVITFAYGSKHMYDYINDNPSIAFMPVDYVNDPAVICLNDNQISVNSALEVDFFGQVCAESIGTRQISGTGGQVDFVRGACTSKGGKSFIAFASTAKGGTISKIKSILTPGAIVTTSKNDIDCIVTEYGIASLRGRPLSERAKALISIAHPDFRDELRFEAKSRGIII